MSSKKITILVKCEKNYTKPIKETMTSAATTIPIELIVGCVGGYLLFIAIIVFLAGLKEDAMTMTTVKDWMITWLIWRTL